MHAYKPEPAPGTGGKPVVYVSYEYDTPALYKSGPERGERIPRYWFHVYVAANGKRRYVLFRR